MRDIDPQGQSRYLHATVNMRHYARKICPRGEATQVELSMAGRVRLHRILSEEAGRE